MKDFLKIGIVVADIDEYKPLLNYISTNDCNNYSFLGRTGHRFFVEGENARAEIISVLCGIGKVNAAAVTAHFVDIGCDIVLNFGLSGGISGVRRGDICACASYLEHDFDLTGIGYKPCEKPLQKYIYNADKRLIKMLCELVPGIKIGTAVSGDYFVCDVERRNFLKTAFNAMTCDMETAAAAYVCEFAGLPFVAVRKVSDDAGADAFAGYSEMNAQNDRNLIDIIFALIRKILDSAELFQ